MAPLLLSGLSGSVIEVYCSMTTTFPFNQASKNLGSDFLVYFRHILIDNRYHDLFQLYNKPNSSDTSIKDDRVYQKFPLICSLGES